MIEYLITTYGYPAVFAGAIIEGELALVIAGFAAYLGYLSLPLAILCGVAGSLFGDQFYFYLGRRKGKQILANKPKWRKKIAWIHRFFDRHGTLVMLCFRFAYGFRAITPIFIGTSGVSWKKFLIFNTTGAVIWSVIFTLGGYVFGTTLSIFLTDMKHYEFEAIVVIVILVAVLWTLAFFKERLLLKKFNE
jgi:membrane protein DedA with SNARE-associated domain